MSASLWVMPQKRTDVSVPSVLEMNLEEWYRTFDGLRAAVSEVGEVRQAFAIYQYLKEIEKELSVVTDMAGARCEQLMERL